MQQLVGHDIGSYTFDPDHGNITFVGVTPTLDQILSVVNKSAGNQLLQLGTMAGAVLHLASACHGMHSTDALQIYVDMPGVVTPVGGTIVAEGYVWDTGLLDWVPMQQPILNAGSVTIPAGITVNSSALPTGAATETTLQSVAGFNIPKNDEIQATYPNPTTEIYTYKLASVTVGTVTVTYSDATKNVFVSAVKS